MNLVITMAGNGQRFRDAGYNIPKYEITVHGKTLFEWSMRSFDGMTFSKYIFIVKKSDNAREFIVNELKKLNINNNISIIELDKPTAGQAETALMANCIWDKDEPLLIYNIDTYVKEGEFLNTKFEGDGFIPCFNAPGDHWSFVKLENNKVVEIREKKRISNNCTLGAYYFKSAELYENIYKSYYENKNTKLDANEYYIAPLYNEMLNQGKEIKISIIDIDKINILGTVEELEIFKNKVI